MRALTIVLATILVMAVVGDSANMEKILQDLGFPTDAGTKPADRVDANPMKKAPEKGKGRKISSGPAKPLDSANAMTHSSQKSGPKGNKIAQGVDKDPTNKAPAKGKGEKLSSGPAKPLDLVKAILAQASQESGPKGKESNNGITIHPTNDVPEVTEGTNFTPGPAKGLDTAHTITPAPVETEGKGPAKGANVTPTSKATWTKFTFGQTTSLDCMNAITPASEKPGDAVTPTATNHNWYETLDFNYADRGSGTLIEGEDGDIENEEGGKEVNITGDTFLVRRENGENYQADYSYGEMGSGDSFLVRKENGEDETKDYNNEEGGSGNDVGDETEDYDNEKRGRDMTIEDGTYLETRERSEYETEDYNDQDDGSADNFLVKKENDELLRGVSTGHAKRQQDVEALVSGGQGIGQKIKDKLGDRLAEGIVENYQEKVVSGLQDYVGKQTEKSDNKYKDVLKDTSGLAAGLNRPVEEADIQLVPKAGATMGNMYAPPGWEIRHKYKNNDKSDEDKGSSRRQTAAYTYPNGLGPVLMNGCFGSDYKEGDPCFKAKIPSTGCTNLINGATYLGVGFDGRGVYSAESRKKSIIQRSCSNLFSENEVPDSMTVQGIYDTDVKSHTFSSLDEYRQYLEEKSAVTSAKAMFQEEINKASGYGAGNAIGFGLGGAAGRGHSSNSGNYQKSSGFRASSFARGRLGEKQTQTFMAMLEMNIFRYEIFMDDVKPEQLNVGFLRDFISLPQSYFSPGAEIIFQNFYLRWGTHYIKSAKFGGQLKIIKTKQATRDLSMSEFATRAEADWKMTLSTFSAQASQTKSSSWWHDHESKTESQQSTGKATDASTSKANRNQEKQASSQEYSNEVLSVQGGDQHIAAAITEMYTTALATELKDWLESIKDYPKPFSFVLRPVSDLLNIPFDSLFPAGNVDYGCFGRRNLKTEKGTGRKYYTQKTAKSGVGNTAGKNVSETVMISEIRYCDFTDRKALENTMTKRRLALERAVMVYLEEGRILSSDFLLPAGDAGCETATLAYLQGSNNGVPTWKEMTGGQEFTVIFDMPYDIPEIIEAQDVLQLKFIRHMWFSTRRGSVPHLYDGYENEGRNDAHGKKVIVLGLVMTYNEETGVFKVTDDDFKTSAPVLPDLPEWIKGRKIARAEYKELLNHLNRKTNTMGDVPCSIQWSNAHRLDPTDGGKCIHFTAASEGDIFVVFASIPQNHETWVYIQISPDGVALYKAMRLQTTQLNDIAGSLGSATLYQSYFVCVIEDANEKTTVIQYGKTPDNEERPHVWLSFTFHELASLRYYSFGNGGSLVKVMGLSVVDKPVKDYIICREGTVMISGICRQKCHSECKGCRTSGSNRTTDCIACKHLKVPRPGRIGSFECVAQCPQHMKAVTATKTCKCIKRMEEARPNGVSDCVTECPRTHFDDNNVCKKCSSFCKDVSDEGKRACSGPASKDCNVCKYKHNGRCVEECRPGQKAVKTGGSGAFVCNQCRAGHECKLGDEREDICPAGTASNDNRTMCEPCAAGEYSSTHGATFCQKCPTGKYSTGGRSIRCFPCPAGKYSSEAGSTGCTICSTGKYSSTAGSKSCAPCPVGKYSDGKGSTDCKACPAGKYSSQIESTTCTSCPVGQYSSTAGSTNCTVCPAGKFSSTKASTSCMACPAGQFSNTAESSSCRACPAGQYSAAGSTGCTDCPPGRYSGTTGSASCVACPAGKYSPTAGSTSCTACPAGKYSSRVGSTSCTACPAGKYSSTAGSTRCGACPAGQYSSGAASRSCRRCPPRLLSRPGSSKCSCPSGYTKFQRSCFKAFGTTTAYSSAERVCQAGGGYLAMPKDSATNTFLAGLAYKTSRGSKFHIGLSDRNREKQWVYADGTRLGRYNNWGPGEPNNYRRRNEDCGELRSNKRWNDAPCNYRYRFLCEVKLPRGHY